MNGISLIMNSGEFKADDIALLQNIKAELKALRVLESVMLDDGEFSMQALWHLLSSKGIACLRMPIRQLIKNPNYLKTFDVLILNILGFQDIQMEILATRIEKVYDLRKQTLRVNRWYRLSSGELELLDFNEVSLNARYRRLRVENTNTKETGIAVSSPIWIDDNLGWQITVETAPNEVKVWGLKDIDPTPFFHILF